MSVSGTGPAEIMGATGGIIAAHKQSQQSIKAFREARMQANRLYAVGNQAAGTAQAANLGAQQTLAQAEQARTGLISQLGAPGTYEQSYEDFVRLGGTSPTTAPPAPTVSGPADYGSLASYIKQYMPTATAIPGTSTPGSSTTAQGQGSLTQLLSLIGQQQQAKAGSAQQKGLQNAIQNLLGQPGTQAAIQGLSQQTSPYQLTSTFTPSAKAKYSLPTGLATTQGLQIDPAKYVNQIMSSREGRMASYLTAQADQLLRGQGPLYNSLVNNIQSSLFDSAAALSRQNAEQLRMMVAQGGDARNRAVATALQQQNIQNVQMQLAGQVAQSRMNLDMFAMDNARRTAAFNEAWTNGLPGISQSFLDAWTQTAQFYGNSILPQVIASAGGAAAAGQNAAAFQAAAGNSGQLWGAALSALGGATSGGGMSQLTSMIKNWISPTPSTTYGSPLSSTDVMSLFGAGGATSLPAGASDLGAAAAVVA